ncbi:hypothetical protein JVT61DRAFT_5940 [Boletus reticuloceps]|uniref:AAA+ ATPase domain-containing protein n=1 Tax=Boletus reticuloceps TaxID=495285 RepID=A0A8I2YKG9_9AGAM|nr:hypothetical protein JVT61DRAFT_5940 [Boletus reticuloceps]
MLRLPTPPPPPLLEDTMNTANLAQNTATQTITVKDIKLHNPARRKLPAARQYYVQFSVGDTSRSTNTAKEVGNRTSWDNTLEFDAGDQSVLLVNVCQKHRIGDDKVIGVLTDTIGGILGKLKDGVLEDTLHKDTSSLSDLSEITIKFALAAEPCKDVNADERQAMDAQARTIETVKLLRSTPAAVNLLSSAVDTGTQVATEAQTLENTRTFKSTWDVLLQRIELIDKIITGIAEIHPYASMAWSVISAAKQVLVNQKNRDNQIMCLVGTMSDAFTFVHDAEPLKTIKVHMKTITLLVQQVTECGYFIIDYAKRKNFWIRMAKYTISDIDGRIKEYEEKFRELKAALLEGVAVQTEITVIRMMNVVKDAEKSIDLNDMPYASGARYAPEKGCLPETRESFLREIRDILNNPDDDAPRVCLLTGVAGSGKSAVAHSIARLYDEQRRLGSSYCFASTDAATRNPQNLFSTIARDLCDHAIPFKSALWEVVKYDRSLRMSQSPFVQVENLIIKPSKALHAIGPLVIVIDALDESGDWAKRQDLLRAISDKLTALPTNLRFLITARPEDDILRAFPPSPRVVRMQMGDIAVHLVDRDIETFIHHSLHGYTELQSFWRDREWCRLLVHHSQHLFQWASTACKFIQGEGTIGLDPCERLDQLLQGANTDGGHSLDNIYHTVLSQLFTSGDTRERFRTVMAIVLALHEPLSLASLSALLRRDLNVRAIIKPMGSLLDGVVNETKPIRPLHTSFRDFLLDKTRSSDLFHVSIQPLHSLLLGQTLLACMQRMLKFNIGNLKDSRIRNTAIPNLPCQVNNAIPPHLAYSCQYWMHHLQLADHTLDLLNEVTLFVKTSFPLKPSAFFPSPLPCHPSYLP